MCLYLATVYRNKDEHEGFAGSSVRMLIFWSYSVASKLIFTYRISTAISYMNRQTLGVRIKRLVFFLEQFCPVSKQFEKGVLHWKDTVTAIHSETRIYSAIFLFRLNILKWKILNICSTRSFICIYICMHFCLSVGGGCTHMWIHMYMYVCIPTGLYILY